MNILARSVYLGPNLYALFPVIRLTVDLGPLEDWPSARLGEDAFVAPLLERLPGLHEHGCSYGEPGGFVRRLREGEGTWLGHVLEHVAIELQNVAGADVTFGKTRGTGVPGQYDVIYEYEQDEIGLQAAELGRRLLADLLPESLRPAALPAGPFDFEAERDAFIRFAQNRALGPSTAALVRAAEARDIPWLRLNRFSLIQLGHGKYGKRIQATVTSETRHIAVEMASDKEETNRLLADLGLPVPRQMLVYDPDEAVLAAGRIGYPVVVKPLNANHGRGCRSTWPGPTRSPRRLSTPASTAGRSSSRASSRASTTACSSSTVISSPRPSACPATSSATACTRWPSWSTSSTWTRGAGSGTRRC